MSTRPFNVDIFDRKYNMVHHYTAGDAKHSEDYLSLVENSTLITFNENVQKGYYIRLSDGEREYFGIISGIHTGNVAKGYSEIKYKQFMSLFDTRILFDTDYQTSTGVHDLSLEETIAKYITDYFINNEDVEQNIPGLTVRTVSSTKPWGLNLTSQVKGLHKTIINFYNSILSRSLTKYGVGINFVPDFNAKTITVEVGQKNTSVFRIEADLDSVIARNIVLNETSEDTNKLVVYDDRDLATKMVFFKHPDRTYDTVDDDRIVPVIYGGGQQNGMRSGTENVPGIAGMGVAAEEAYRNFDAAQEYLYCLKERLESGLAAMEDVVIHGMRGREGAPHIVNASFIGVGSEVLLHSLEDRGIYISAGSACSTHKRNASPTMAAIGAPKEEVSSAVRFSFSETNTEEEVDRALAAIRELLPVLRRYQAR